LSWLPPQASVFRPAIDTELYDSICLTLAARELNYDFSSSYKKYLKLVKSFNNILPREFSDPLKRVSVDT